MSPSLGSSQFVLNFLSKTIVVFLVVINFLSPTYTGRHIVVSVWNTCTVQFVWDIKYIFFHRNVKSWKVMTKKVVFCSGIEKLSMHVLDQKNKKKRF